MNKRPDWPTKKPQPNFDLAITAAIWLIVALAFLFMAALSRLCDPVDLDAVNTFLRCTCCAAGLSVVTCVAAVIDRAIYKKRNKW